MDGRGRVGQLHHVRGSLRGRGLPHHQRGASGELEKKIGLFNTVCEKSKIEVYIFTGGKTIIIRKKSSQNLHS